MTNLDSILKSRDVTLPAKVCLVNAMVFPVVTYVCESWTIKKAEHRRIDAFGQWCWRRLLRVPWTAQRSSQSILKEISPEYSLEGLSWSWNCNTLATWCEELTHLKRPWCWERLKAEEEGDDRGWDGWMASLTQWTWVWVNSGSWWWTGRPAVHGVAKSRTWLSNWTELNCPLMDKDKRLMEASWWERLTEGESLVLMGGTCSVNLQSNFLLLGRACSLPVVWPEAELWWGNEGEVAHYSEGPRHSLLHSGPRPCSRPLLTHASAWDPWTLTGKSGSVSCGVTAPFSWSWCVQGSVSALQESVSPVLC